MNNLLLTLLPNQSFSFQQRQKDVLLERANPPEEKQMITIQRLTSGMIFVSFGFALNKMQGHK